MDWKALDQNDENSVYFFYITALSFNFWTLF